jgi:hypothetical protein
MKLIILKYCRMIEFNNGLNHRETKMYLFSQKQVALTSVAQEIETLGAKTHLSSHNHNQMAKMQVIFSSYVGSITQGII